MGKQKVIKTGGDVTIHYSMLDFLAAMKRHPLLWERNHPQYHLRRRRDQTWREIGRQLYGDFDQLSTDEQLNIGRTLQKRWKNARDSLLKAHRAKQNGDQFSTYVYEKEMSFLLNRANSDIAFLDCDMDDQTNDVVAEKNDLKAVEPKAQRASKRQKQNFTSGVRASIKVEETKSGRSPKKRTNTSISDSSEDFRVFEEFIDQNDDGLTPNSSSMLDGAGRTDEHLLPDKMPKREIDADQAFFDAIKPAMRDLSIDRKLDLQIEILKLLRNFRSK